MIGILGGMGTQAGLDFCNKLAILYRGKIDQEYPLFLLFNKSNIPGTKKNQSYWASGVSVVAHMKNPKIPAVHFNTRFVVTSKRWFGGGMDVTPSQKDFDEKKLHAIYGMERI